MTGGKNQTTSTKTCPIANLSDANPTATALGISYFDITLPQMAKTSLMRPSHQQDWIHIDCTSNYMHDICIDRPPQVIMYLRNNTMSNKGKGKVVPAHTTKAL